MATDCCSRVIEQTARPLPSSARPGAEFFAQPGTADQRRYEVLRAYLLEGLSAAEAASRFGYTAASVASMARDFRAGRRDFFTDTKPGPKSAPAKDAAGPGSSSYAGPAGRPTRSPRSWPPRAPS
jgi:hypothetical protein